MTRVLVASASKVERARLEVIVSANRSVELVGRSHSLPELSRDVENLEPDVVVVQMDQPDEDALAEFEAVSKDHVGLHLPAVVLLTPVERIAALSDATRVGINALLPPEATASEISAAIEAAAAGLFVIHAGFLDALPETQAPRLAPLETSRPSLTPREIEVLNLMAQGLGNKEIAWKLGISEHTVKFHIGSIFNKLDASGRTEAVILGIRAGLIML